MRLEPIGDKVVIRRMETEEQTAGGIVLPDAARHIPQQGRVLSVGDGEMLPAGERAPHQVKEGDLVVFSTYAASDVFIDGEELLIISESDILAVLN